MSSTSTPSTSSTSSTPTFTRLPTHVVPQRYDVRIQTDFQKFSFDGQLSITVLVKTETSEIVVNAAEITVHSAQWAGAETHPATITNQIEEERIVFSFPSPLKPGVGVLSMTYTGNLNDQMKGYYRSKYVINGEERTMGATQFQAADARRAFPCWDEPEPKSVFGITLVVPPNRVAISNMPAVSQKQISDDGTQEVVFGDTPQMSTYLVAWVIGEFEYLEEKTSKGVAIRVYVPPGKKEQGTFGLSVATKVLPFFEDYFGSDYPLSKLDLIAIPDFGPGAMENWGCITYRETCILVDPVNTSSATKHNVALTVSHELAHQWFGNLVTMKWWTDLWLNEGFATWIEYLAVHHMFPEWNIWNQYSVDDFNTAMNLDSLKNSHPIEVDVQGGPQEIDAIFDAISYSKGSVVIRMLENYLGADVFKKGLQHYLNKYAYQNTETKDLWDALSVVSGKHVAELMGTWTKQTGYPVLFVKEIPCVEAGRKFEISQERFFSNPPVVQSADDQDPTLWQIPLSYNSGSSLSQKYFGLITERVQQIWVQDIKKEDWIRFNPEAVGFYRVYYSKDLLDQLSQFIHEDHQQADGVSEKKELRLSVVGRIALESDVFAFAQSGISPPSSSSSTINTVDYLKLLLSFENENEFSVWDNIADNLSVLNLLIRDQEYFDSHFAKFGRQLFSKVFQKVGWDPKNNSGEEEEIEKERQKEKEEQPLVPRLRSIVLAKLGGYQDRSVIDEALRRFSRFYEKGIQIPPDQRTLVYAMAVRNDPNNYHKLFELYEKTDHREEKTRMAPCLGTVSTRELLERTLEFALSDKIRVEDSLSVIGTVAANKHQGHALVWDWFLKNEKFLFEKRLPAYFHPRLLRVIMTNTTNREHFNAIKQWASTNQVPGTERVVAQAIERMERNILWLERDSAAIEQYLKERFQ